MSIMRINWDPGADGLRKFGLTLFMASIVAAGVLFWRGHPMLSIACVAVGGLVLLVSLLSVRLALPLYRGWMGIALVAGSVMSTVMLAVVYFGVVTPLALLMRLTGRDRLRLRLVDTSSYWQDIPPVSGNEHQF